MEPQLISRGDERRAHDLLLAVRASMEPQLISRGDRVVQMPTPTFDLPLQWSPSSSAGETPRPRGARPTRRIRFNGAPAHQPGRRIGRLARAAGERLLQWSPSSSAGETGSTSATRTRTSRFNGAPAHQPGRLESTRGASGARGFCFNGAPAHQPGRLVVASSVRSSAHALQWSPSSSAGETPGPRRERHAPRRASMEPQLISRGDGECDVAA